MTQATHWFADKLIDYNQSQDTGMMIIKIPSWEYFELKAKAKEMEKQQIKDAWDNGAYGSGEFMSNIETSQEYYNHIVDTNEMVEDTPMLSLLKEHLNSITTEQFNNEIDEIHKDLGTSSQTEISDEEIEKEADNTYVKYNAYAIEGFIDGAKWYREQLKQL